MKDFKKFTKDGKRIAAFGYEVEKSGVMHLRMYLLFCSRKDEFSKRFAKNKFEEFIQYQINKEVHPQIFDLPIRVGDTAEYTFRRYMNTNFFRKSEIVSRIPVIKTVLFQGEEQHLIGIKRLNKI